MGQRLLRISIQSTENATAITLEGRVAGLWAAELERVWKEKAPLLASTAKLSIDLSNVIYADADGKRVLSRIHARTGAELVTGNPWTQYL
ncbi:MAG: hypothetical protein ABR907_09975, partial [Terracidiphilus sp.]